jgi:catechol O-methyltransferase
MTASRLLRGALLAGGAVAAAVVANELAGKPIPFLRWSLLRMAVDLPGLEKRGQVGDGRERALALYVVKNSRVGDIDDVIRAIDEFARKKSFLMNVGDEKGEILDAAVRRAKPKVLLELGTYCGYSALRTIRAMPADAKLYSIDINSANARIARQIWEHAGVGERVTALVGMIGDSGTTIARLRDDHGFTEGSLDFVFLDHHKAAYLTDLRRILEEGWLHEGSVVVADNVKVPGAPDFLAYLRANEATVWRTVEHDSHVEYQNILKDLVTESDYLGEV